MLNGEWELSNSQYLLMSNRCMHELKTMKVHRAAEKMDEEDASKSICVTELGQSVLTLQEVVQTFDVDSPMYNIKLREDDEYRTVVLKKNKVVIDGETKLIIMINDVTDKVRFEQE